MYLLLMQLKPKISLSKYIVIIDKVDRLLNDPVLPPTPPLTPWGEFRSSGRINSVKEAHRRQQD